MSEVQRINITLPAKLVQKSKILIAEGLYSSFSELIRESIKNEILLDRDLIDKKRTLNKWFSEEQGRGHDTSHLTKEELILRIRKIREDLWDQKYKEWFSVLAG